MSRDDFFDFMIEGGDELMNTEECPHCGQIIHLEQNLEWVDRAGDICKCPHCGETVKIK